MTTTFTRPAWLDTAAFYEIYPQSFCDTNGDGIGDIPGITGKLDYIASLGCNALWINPCYDSPFKDAGYDVRDYRKVAPRYGTNDDLVELFRQAHARGIPARNIRGSKKASAPNATSTPTATSGTTARSKVTRCRSSAGKANATPHIS